MKRAPAILLMLAALAVAAPRALAANYLWEVTSLTNRVYLFGTVHAGKQSWYPLPSAVEDALTDARVLVVEADITDTAKVAKAAPVMTYDPPDSLAKHVDPVDYERFRKVAARLEVPEPQVAQMKPFMAISLLVFAEWGRLGYVPQYGVDGYVIARAKGQKKKIVEIEGVEVQTRLIESLTDEEARMLFSGTLTALESGLTGEQITGMVNAWQAGDPELLLQIARKYNELVPGAREFEEKFIWSRHERMAAKIEDYLNRTNERHFIAVGSLHLAGPRGLVEILRKRGYIVRQQ